jgi:hypothetical protein
MYCLDNMTRPNLSNVQISSVGDSLFAILKAANGAMLDSIGRGMLTIGTVTVVAYIFKDTDLVHNLLGIAPFANRGSKASFDSSHFYLYHLDRKPMLVGTRHAQNLWRIDMPELQQPCKLVPAYAADQVCLSHHPADPDA